MNYFKGAMNKKRERERDLDRNDLLYTDLTDEQQHPTKNWSRTW